MNNKITKSVESKLDKKSFETAKQEAGSLLENQEWLPDHEREKLRREVLKEVESKKKPASRPIEPTPLPPIQPSLPKSPVMQKIEKVLENDLADIYFSMQPDLQKKFKEKGEDTASKIEKLLLETKVRADKIFRLIVEWLKIIPGVNRFFIQQEAKIKTDTIIEIKK